MSLRMTTDTFFRRIGSRHHCIGVIFSRCPHLVRQTCPQAGNVITRKDAERRCFSIYSRSQSSSRNTQISHGKPVVSRPPIPASREACDTILYRLPTRLKALVKAGLLSVKSKLPMLMENQPIERSHMEALLSIALFELQQPVLPYHTRRDHRLRLIAYKMNIDLIRKQLDQMDASGEVYTRFSSQEDQNRLQELERRRTHYQIILRGLQRRTDLGRADRQRLEQTEAALRAVDGKIRRLQSFGSNKASQNNEGENDDHELSQAEHASLYKRLMHEPISLPGIVQYELSRDLLDSLYEASFEFGQRHLPTRMQRNGWNIPQAIDLSEFMSLFAFIPELYHLHSAHKLAMNGIRQWRNQFVHGLKIMPVDELLVLLNDMEIFAAAVDAKDLMNKVIKYQNLLSEFKSDQIEHNKRALMVAESVISELTAMSKLETQKVAGGVQRPHAEDSAAIERTGGQTTASKAKILISAWEDTIRATSLLAAERTAVAAGEAQIRRMLDNLGPSTSMLLTNNQLKIMSDSRDWSIKNRTEQIFAAFDRRLLGVVPNRAVEETMETKFPTTKKTGIASGLRDKYGRFPMQGGDATQREALAATLDGLAKSLWSKR